MSKPIAFKCPHGDHLAYFHSVDIVVCLTHGRLLYTDIPAKLQKKTNYRSDWLRMGDRDAKKYMRLKVKIGKAIVKVLNKRMAE